MGMRRQTPSCGDATQLYELTEADRRTDGRLLRRTIPLGTDATPRRLTYTRL